MVNKVLQARLMEKKRTSPELFYDCVDSPLGPLWIVAGKEGLSYLFIQETESAFLAETERRTGKYPIKKLKPLSRWRSILDRYFSGERIRFDGPLVFLEGTAFQQKIWRTLLQIPYGTVKSYQWVGEQLSMKHAGRAVGNACGKNPLPVIVPCHRVVRQDGTLGGYTGGLGIKKKLLGLEGVL